ncbi:hypothetical protein ACWGJ9_08195 [Curtobacterium citreum]
MKHILEHARALRGPLRSIAMDQPDKQAETRASLRVLAEEVAELGRPDLDAIMSDALDAADGHADEDIDRLLEKLR